MVIKDTIKIIIITAVLCLGASGCSVDRSNIFSQTYHNITARYNAYFIANEHMKDVESAIKESYDRNFNKTLMTLPPVDTSVVSSKSTELEECVKKASIAIQRHKNSKWVDDSYILIGKARFYNQEYEDAVETFKYVNVNSDDDNARHQALINLMRTFIEKNEFNNAIYVSDYLKKEDLNKENTKNLALMRAHLYQMRGDPDNMVKNLLEAAPMLKKRDGKSRIYFILGQLYQEKGFDAEAYKYYTQCIRSNPDYELSFYAKLNMAQVTELSDGSDVKKTRKYFRGLLRDRKNEEFKDKIYYEMAQFELKQGNLEEAINYYSSSVASSVNNPRQKGYSYLRLGQVYFDSLKQYETAKSYYDSVVSVLPQDDELFSKVKDRQSILSEFVDQINIIHDQDSLLQLSSMDSVKLMAYIDEYIETREKEEEERLARLEKESRRTAQSYDAFGDFGEDLMAAGNRGQGGQWYFYNPSSISAGRNEFVRMWGNRPLEDNWRRSRKGSSGPTGYVQSPTADSGEALPQEAGEPQSLTGLDRRQLYAAVPKTEEEKSQALSLIEGAYYRLGNIYNFNLDEKLNAAETFETLIDRFPESEHEPEVLYLLHLIYKALEDEKSRQYKDELINTHPNSLYAKLLINPNYREESNAVVEVLQNIYKEAFDLYKIDSLNDALTLVEEGLKEYPDNTFSDNLELLKILIIGKTDGVYNYQFALQQFIENHPDSDVLGYAQDLLAAIDRYKADQLRRQGVSYRPNLDQNHYFVLVYNLNDRIAERLIARVNGFIKDKSDLKTANLTLDKTRSMILVDDFPTKEEALEFYQKFNESPETLGELKNYNINNFVITKDNFETLYSTKGLDYYVAFFNKNYQ